MTPMTLRTLITGACGQIGTELTEAMVERYGSDGVVASDIRKSASFGCDFVLLDVTDASAISRVLKQYGIGRVVHLAAVLSAKGEENPSIAYELNISGLKNVLDASVQSGVKQFFFPSTIAVYGPETPKEMVPINTVTRPVSIYGIGKLFGELLCSYYHTRYGLDTRGMRLPGIVSWKAPPGGGTTDYAVQMIESAVHGRNYVCFLRESTRLPMMYMPDAIASIIALIEAPSSSLRYRTSYNVSAFSFSPQDLEKELRKHFSQFFVQYAPDHRQTVADGWPRSLDVSDAILDWGFHSTYSFEEMVSDMIQHLKEREASIAEKIK